MTVNRVQPTSCEVSVALMRTNAAIAQLYCSWTWALPDAGEPCVMGGANVKSYSNSNILMLLTYMIWARGDNSCGALKLDHSSHARPIRNSAVSPRVTLHVADRSLMQPPRRCDSHARRLQENGKSDVPPQLLQHESESASESASESLAQVKAPRLESKATTQWGHAMSMPPRIRGQAEMKQCSSPSKKAAS